MAGWSCSCICQLHALCYYFSICLFCARIFIMSFFFFFFWATGESSTLRQLMKVPNEPGLSPNNGLANVSLSDQSMASNPRKGQVICPGAKTTSHDGRAFITTSFTIVIICLTPWPLGETARIEDCQGHDSP